MLCDILVSSRKDHPSDLNYDCCINAASPQGFLLQRWETSDSFLFYTRWRLQCLQAQKLLAENLVSQSLHWIRVLSALLDVKSEQPKQYIQRDRQTSGPTDEMVLIKVVTVASHCGWNLFIGKQTCLILQAMTFYEESENSTRDTHSHKHLFKWLFYKTSSTSATKLYSLFHDQSCNFSAKKNQNHIPRKTIRRWDGNLCKLLFYDNRYAVLKIILLMVTIGCFFQI